MTSSPAPGKQVTASSRNLIDRFSPPGQDSAFRPWASPENRKHIRRFFSPQTDLPFRQGLSRVSRTNSVQREQNLSAIPPPELCGNGPLPTGCRKKEISALFPKKWNVHVVPCFARDCCSRFGNLRQNSLWAFSCPRADRAIVLNGLLAPFPFPNRRMDPPFSFAFPSLPKRQPVLLTSPDMMTPPLSFHSFPILLF